MTGFTLKRWEVTVAGYGCAPIEAASRGKAIARAWRSDAFNAIKFGDFLRMVSCRRDDNEPLDWGDPITVDGRPAFFVEATRSTVRFVHPGSDTILSAHPYDVLPVEYRPEQYRPSPSLKSEIARLGEKR